MSKNLQLVKADAIVLFQKFHDDDTPSISLAENWELFGYAQKGHTFRAFEQCGFVEGEDYFPRLETNVITRYGKEVTGSPTKDYLLTPRTLDHFGMMLRNENGRAIREAYRECRKIVESFNGKFEQLAGAVVKIADTLAKVVDRLDRLESRVSQPQIESRKPLRLMMGRNKATAQCMADYISAYGMAKFGIMVANSYRQHFGEDPHKWGSTKNSEWAYSDQEFTAISDNLMERLRDANVRIHKKSKRLRKNSKPDPRQQDLFN